MLNSSPGIILRVQKREIAYHIILRVQKSVLIRVNIWPHHISGGVNSGSYRATCAGTWSYHLVAFLLLCFFCCHDCFFVVLVCVAGILMLLVLFFDLRFFVFCADCCCFVFVVFVFLLFLFYVVPYTD